jgi:hypothetical protein
MKVTQFFTHRPPSRTIHLLSDPFPERLNSSPSLFRKAENLSAQREHIAPLKTSFASMFGMK